MFDSDMGRAHSSMTREVRWAKTERKFFFFWNTDGTGFEPAAGRFLVRGFWGSMDGNF